MTIPTSQSTEIFLGNGVTNTFTFSFVGDAASDIVVTYTDTTGKAIVLTSSQYTLSLNAAAAGSLWGVGGTVTYPTAGSPIANGTSLTVARILPLTQTTSISNQGSFAPSVIESALDTLEMQIQQTSARTGLFRGTWATGQTYNFGDYVIDGTNGANTGNYYICILTNISGTWATDLAAGDWNLAINVQGISSYATSAAASATAAASSSTSAATSATNAATSASSASTQATNAATSATSASSSATSATSSASSATTSASTATTQATNASTSATSAATSATAAAASAAVVSTVVHTITTSATPAVDLSTGRNFKFTTSAGTTFTFSNPDATGNNCSFALFLFQDGTGETITWPASVKWSNGIVPVLTAANAKYTLTFTTIDGGTTYDGYLTGEALA